MSLLRRIEYYKPNLCIFCKYFELMSRGNGKGCAVFSHFNRPVPVEIRRMRYDHRYPHPEDGGIQFERVPLPEVARQRYFRDRSDEEIEVAFQKILEDLDATHHNGIPPTSQGHLPSFWYMYDE